MPAPKSADTSGPKGVRLVRWWWHRSRVPFWLDRKRPYFAAALGVINRHDPEGLLADGAPEDEYSNDVRDFASILSRGEAITPEVVRDVWQAWFCGSSRSSDEWAALAKDLDALRSRDV